jgi:hypothetical protein
MNGRSDGGERWSIRQTAIYHQHNLQDQRCVWVILNARPQSLASATVEKFLKTPDAVDECVQNPFTIDELLMTSHLRMWTPYIRSYERTIIDVVSRLVIFHPPGFGSVQILTPGTVCRHAQSPIEGSHWD